MASSHISITGLKTAIVEMKTTIDTERTNQDKRRSDNPSITSSSEWSSKEFCIKKMKAELRKMQADLDDLMKSKVDVINHLSEQAVDTSTITKSATQSSHAHLGSGGSGSGGGGGSGGSGSGILQKPTEKVYQSCRD